MDELVDEIEVEGIDIFVVNKFLVLVEILVLMLVLCMIVIVVSDQKMVQQLYLMQLILLFLFLNYFQLMDGLIVLFVKCMNLVDD